MSRGPHAANRSRAQAFYSLIVLNIPCWCSRSLWSDPAAGWVYGWRHIRGGANLFLLLFCCGVKGLSSASASHWLFSIFLRWSLFNHDLYKHGGVPTCAVVATAGHWEPFTSVRFYFKWSMDASQLSQTHMQMFALFRPAAQRLKWISFLYCSWVCSLCYTALCIAGSP